MINYRLFFFANATAGIRSIWLIFAFFIFYSGAAMAVSEPKYVVVSLSNNYETRLYESTIVAETIVESDFEGAGSMAFQILADYIFGNNQSKTKIDMTAPVSQIPISEKIEMTAPVTQLKKLNGHLVQFTMPEGFTMETLPIPNDSRVQLRKIPARKVAVYKYSGSWSESRYKSKLAEFNSELSKDNVTTVGEPIFARFNSPLQFWFLRRNEIWQEVKN